MISTSVSPVWRTRLLTGVALLSLLVVFHNFGLPLLPERTMEIDPHQVVPLDRPPSVAYVYPFSESAPDRPHNPHSRVRLFEDGAPLQIKAAIGSVMLPLRGGAWAHVPGYIVFSATDNSDPRTGQHRYTLRYPAGTSETVGLLAAGLFVLSVIGLWRGPRPSPSEACARDSNRIPWHVHLGGISVVLLAGIYCNTGTLAPYANTGLPLVDPATGYLYNIDHLEFRALFNFVDGAPRSQWEHGLLLRRVLYPVLAWPFMHLAGFKTGGLVANLLLNWGGLMLTLGWLRRRVGERGALLAGWLLALYPGVAYWGGLPYLYALIFPLSLLLTVGLVELAETSDWRMGWWYSLALGVGYLGYDFIVYYLPASLLVLGARRQWRLAGIALIGQLLPLAFWLWILKHGFGVPVLNSNSGTYGAAVAAYLDPAAYQGWLDVLAVAPAAAWHVWFGCNFQFLPLLFLLVVVLNPLTARLRFAPVELALLAVAGALFLFLNLAPDQNLRWNMRGSWISRLYQPIFPVMILFIARWWQHLPAPGRLVQRSFRLALCAVLAGNALIIFGSLSGNPWRLPEETFYRFYTHTDVILLRPYESNLREYGRRPWGFVMPFKVPETNNAP
jgi:hypothetical protein